MNKEIFLKVGSVLLSIIKNAIVPNGKIYAKMKHKTLIALIFLSFFIGRVSAYFLLIKFQSSATITPTIAEIIISEGLMSVTFIIFLNLLVKVYVDVFIDKYFK